MKKVIPAVNYADPTPTPGVTEALVAHLAGDALTIAWAYFVKRSDGVVLGFTTHVTDQFVRTRIPDVPGIVGQYAATVLCKATSSIVGSDIQTTDSLAQTNLEIEATLSDLGITEDDIRAGLYRAAQVEIAIYNYNDLTMGTNTVFMGTLGGAEGGDTSVRYEQRGLTQPLDQQLDGLTGPMCRVQLGSPRCGVDLGPYTRTGVIASPVADRIFTDAARTEPDDWWTKGEITITAADGRVTKADVKHSLADGTIELVDEVYYGLSTGDAYSITPGCNKLLKMPGDVNGQPYTGDCRVKFHNVLRFVGEPEIPGQIAIQQYGGQTVV